MTPYEPIEVESTDLKPRDVRALTEYLTVLPDVGRARDADDLYLVISESGSEYLVDARTDACDCPDVQYNLSTDDGRETCKHRARVAYETGERPIPAFVEPNTLPSDFSAHVASTPRIVATDGGVLESRTDKESDESERPNDCDCSPTFDDLLCWPCYRDGFETPNSDAE